MDDIIVELIKNFIDTKYENLPEEAIENTKRAVLDTLGVLIAGAPDCHKEVDLIKEWGGKEESTILIYGGRVPAHNAAWVNSTMASACDFDGGMGAFHEAASIVPTALAVSELQGKVSGREFITSILLAEDLARRITMSCQSGGVPYANRGFHQNGIIVVFATAALAARLLILDMNGMLNALGIALTRASGTHQVAADKVLALRMTQGFSSSSGIQAAILAQRGISGVKNVMQGTFGFFQLFCRDEGNLNALTDQLGERFGSTYSTKMHPQCGTTQPATEAALRLADEAEIDPKEISHIIVEVSPGVFPITAHPFRLGDNPRVEAQFSVPYTVANAIVRKSSKLEHFTEKFIRDPEIMEIAHKVHPILNTSLEGLSAFVEIEMRDGRKYSKYSNKFPRLSSTEEIKEKFRNCVAFAPDSQAAGNGEEIIDMVDRLEEIDDVSELVKLLV